MSETPPGAPTDDRPPQPFARGRIQWSRPPQATFRVGPLPAGPAQSRFMGQGQRPARPVGGGILSGSMIPPSRPTAPPVTAAPEPEITVDTEFEEIAVPTSESAPGSATIVEAKAAPQPVADPEGAPRPRAGRSTRSVEMIVEAEEPDPADTQAPLSGEAAKAAADPRAIPSVVVTPTLYATVSAAVETVTKSSRWLLIAAAIVVVVTGLFIWMATLPAGEGGAVALDPDAPPPAAPGLVEATPEVAPAPVETTAAAPSTVAPATEPTATRPTPRATRAAGTTPTPAITPEAITPRPYVETAPLESPAPTPAAPPPSDPSAPIQTQPQPLN